jgi:3',5'-cyclic AMP phosphodiesterase CpdA
MRPLICGLTLLVLMAGGWACHGAEVPATRIGFLADTHVNLKPSKRDMAFNRRLDEAIEQVNAAKVDLVLIAGDLTENGAQAQMDLFKRKAKAFKAPVLIVPGNHDVGLVGGSHGSPAITHERVRRYAKELGPNWFVQEKAGVRVVGINSCLFGSGMKEEEDQWKFLEQELAGPHATPTLLLEHYPLFIKDAAEPRIGNRNVQPELRQKLLALIQRAEVRAVLTGHLHYPITNRLDGTLFLGNGTTAFGLPHRKQPEGWMLLSVPRQGEAQFDFRELK